MAAYISLISLILISAMCIAWLVIQRHRQQKNPATLQALPMLHRDSQALYLRLRTALPQYLIFASTSLDMFIRAQGDNRLSVAQRQAELASYTVDFLICNSEFRIVAAIDLDEFGKNRAVCDQGSRLLQEASIPILRWTAANLPTGRDIQEAIAELETAHVLTASLRKTPDTPNSTNLGGSAWSRHEKRL